MNRALVIVDVNQTFFEVQKRFPNKVLDYEALMKAYKDLGYHLQHQLAYGKQTNSKSFLDMLKINGFETIFGNVPHSIQVALKLADLTFRNAYDVLILVTNNVEWGRLLSYAKSNGKYTISVGVDLPEIFKYYSETFELTEDYVMEKRSAVHPKESKSIDGNPTDHSST